MFRNSTKSSVPLGGNCSAELGQNCAPGLQCVRFGAAGNARGKCMLPPGSVSPGKKPSPTPSPTPGPTPSGPRPPGTLGGACMPNVTIRGVAQPRCAPPAKCDTNDGSSTFGKCMLPPPTPGKKPDPGSYGMPCKQLSENTSTCNKGLTCVSGVPSPVCMPTPPGPSGPATKSGMGSKEILTIIGLIFLGLCFLCGLAKMGMKDAKRKSNCDKACGAFVFLGVALIAVSSVLKSSN